MNILAIDTATQVCGAAVVQGETLIADFRLNQKNVHNEKLVSSIERLVSDAGLTLRELQGIAVSSGPGSFTGLRIGLAVAKGLCYTLDIPLTCVNTLDALAFGAPVVTGKVAIILKAREDEAYLAQYDKRQGETVLAGEYKIVKIPEIASVLSEGMMVFGTPEMVPHQECILSEPAVVARLGYKQFIQGQVTDVMVAEPFYLQDFNVKKRQSSHAR